MKQLHYCSFCGKSEKEVACIVTGPPDANICDECSVLVHQIVVEHLGSAPHNWRLLKFAECQGEAA